MVEGAPSSLVIVQIEICRYAMKKRRSRNKLQHFAFRTIVSKVVEESAVIKEKY